ncbi:hypothetical protein PPTG_22434 [Phytophthora nicotianae INRA-310]|uniref:Uncharacterized protein n=1 Tax=Phytophthora nicotianae (strain INRA-310) TaxID=761204 RepID=W2QK62_PHYN3|nr:hypothetical protein PPTG_22434 [Phytophthora nicotianae INRA-310]ETN12934.1 hypothetical protein PPTG_22434 [Phytophthora nicotianae INRA-310]
MAEADTALIILFAAGPPQPPHASAEPDWNKERLCPASVCSHQGRNAAVTSSPLMKMICLNTST